MYHWGTFACTLLRSKGNKYYIFWVCVCSQSHQACNSHEPYFILIYGLSDCTILSKLSYQRHPLRKKNIDHKNYTKAITLSINTEIRVNTLRFADDQVVIVISEDNLRREIFTLQNIAKLFNGNITRKKNGTMEFLRKDSVSCKVFVGKTFLQHVKNCKYLCCEIFYENENNIQ